MKHKSIYALTLAFFIHTSPVLAVTLTNKITGIGPVAHRVDPYICVKNSSGGFIKVEPGASIHDLQNYANQDGDVGIAFRFIGCNESTDPYLGWLSLNVSNKNGIIINSYAPFEHVHVTYNDQKIDVDGNLTGKIQFSEIKTNDNLMSGFARENPTWKFVGANLSGLEFGKSIDPVVIPNLSEEDEMSERSDLKDTQALIAAGMNTFRIPVSWDYLQWDGAGKGDINLEYYNSYVKPLLETLTKKHVTVILDLHSYMRYSIYGEERSGIPDGGSKPEGTLELDPEKYKDVWLKLLDIMKKNPKINMDYIALDLVNEPVDVPEDLVFTIQVSLIKALRDHGFNNYILVEGNRWSGLHSWAETWKSKDGTKAFSNATLFTRKNFEEHGVTDLSKILISVHQYLDSDFSGRDDQCVTNINADDKHFNLKEFVAYLKANNLKAIVTEFGAGKDSNTCENALKQFMDYLKTNAYQADKDYGFVGWTIWSAGHGWGGYKLRVTPYDYRMNVLKQY